MRASLVSQVMQPEARERRTTRAELVQGCGAVD